MWSKTSLVSRINALCNYLLPSFKEPGGGEGKAHLSLSITLSCSCPMCVFWALSSESFV